MSFKYPVQFKLCFFLPLLLVTQKTNRGSTKTSVKPVLKSVLSATLRTSLKTPFFINCLSLFYEKIIAVIKEVVWKPTLGKPYFPYYLVYRCSHNNNSSPPCLAPCILY